MTTTALPLRGCYDLPLEVDPAPRAATDGSAALPPQLLRQNILWLCRLRWSVVGFLVLGGALSYVAPLMTSLGLRHQWHWPLAVAALLLPANVAYQWHARRYAGASATAALANLWCQIIADLLCLTVVVHYCGSLDTVVGFAYLFHIVLACIFFPGTQSLLVTLLAAVLYLTAVGTVLTDVLPVTGILADDHAREFLRRAPRQALTRALTTELVWLVVWYLASHLSRLVRERDAALARANVQLLAAQRERTRHMLHTTHQLKAPFAAIHANTQLLLGGLCGELPAAARDVVKRIADRSRRLASEIKEMLQLANLQTESSDGNPRDSHDLGALVQEGVRQAEQMAGDRHVQVETAIASATVHGVGDHLRMLIANLLANAVIYSKNDGQVHVTCQAEPDGGALLTVEDRGIGIAPEKLPRIFDEYYRTDEAVRHNKESSGLGLAIVRHVAQMHRLRLRVESEPGVGTRFTVRFPSNSANPPN